MYVEMQLRFHRQSFISSHRYVLYVIEETGTSFHHYSVINFRELSLNKLDLGTTLNGPFLAKGQVTETHSILNP